MKASSSLGGGETAEGAAAAGCGRLAFQAPHGGQADSGPAGELFLEQPAAEQRRFLGTVVEKATWRDRELRTTLFEPFEILRRSNSESTRKQKENGGSKADIGIWLRR